MKIDHNFDVVMRHLTQRLTQIEKDSLPKAVPRALNRVAASVRTQAVREVAPRMGVKQKVVRESMQIKRATRSKPAAVVRGFGRPLELHYFQPRQTKQGVTAKAWGKRKLYRGTFIAWIGDGRGGPSVGGYGRYRPMKRRANSRLPIDKLYGPAVPWVMAERAVMRALRKKVRERLPIELRTALNFYTRK